MFQHRHWRLRASFRLLAPTCAVLALIVSATAVVSGSTAAETRLGGGRLMDELPLAFVENQGQVDETVAYYLRGRDTGVYFTAEGLTYTLAGPADPAGQGPVNRWVVRLDFVGASGELRGEAPTGTRISYFKGKRQSWKTGIRTWGKVVYRDLWAGVDLEYEGSADLLKYTLLVGPGTDPSVIRLGYSGAQSVEVNGAGDLVVTTPLRAFTDRHRPPIRRSAGASLTWRCGGPGCPGRRTDGSTTAS